MTRLVGGKAITIRSFNPCFSGSYIMTFITRIKYILMQWVSILVLVDLIL